MALFGFGRKRDPMPAAPARKPPSPSAAEPVFSRALTLGEDYETLYIMTDQHERNARQLITNAGPDGWGWALVPGAFVPEPRNRYDSNAVLVVTDAGPIGYFANGAQDVAKRMIAKSRPRPTIEVGVWLTPDGRISARYFASRRQRDGWVKEREDRSREARMPSVRLKASKEYQAELQQIRRRHDGRADCRIEVDAQPSGKYKDGPRLTFHVDKIGCVGRVDARYRQDEEDFFNTVLTGVTSGELRVLDSFDGTLNAKVYLDATPPQVAPVWTPPPAAGEVSAGAGHVEPTAPRDGMPKNPATVVLPRGSRIQVTGEESFHALLWGWLQPRARWPVIVTLHDEPAARTTTSPRVEVRLFGETVGRLTPASSAHLLPVVHALGAGGRLLACNAEVRGNDLKVDIALDVAKASDLPQEWLNAHLRALPSRPTAEPASEVDDPKGQALDNPDEEV